MIMKRLIFSIALIFFLLCPVFAAAPHNARIGRISVEPEGIEKKALEAVGQEISVAWFEEFTTNEKVLFETFYVPLSAILPFENPVCSVEKDGAVSLLDLSDGAVISFTFSQGLINSISF